MCSKNNDDSKQSFADDLLTIIAYMNKWCLFVGCDLDAVDQYGRTALYLASELGQLDIVRALINSKANINRADTRGCTPFTGVYLHKKQIAHL